MQLRTEEAEHSARFAFLGASISKTFHHGIGGIFRSDITSPITGAISSELAKKVEDKLEEDKRFKKLQESLQALNARANQGGKQQTSSNNNDNMRSSKPENDNSCNAGKGVCHGERVGPEMPQGSKHQNKQEQKSEIKPKIEFFTRKVDYTGWIPGCDPYCQHGYTIFTFSDGKKIIVTGFPERNNMITGDLQVVVTEYNEANTRLFPKGDWDKNHKDLNRRASIITYEFSNDHELNDYFTKAKEAVDFINKGNKGQRFDYDLCGTDNCWGSNSNTVQSYIYKQMGVELKIPKNVNLPGIDGKLYDGPMDNLMKRWGEELQKEQP